MEGVNMKQRIRHLLSVLLVCAMVLSLLPVSVFATGGSGSGLTVDDPMVVPTEGMVITNGTYWGISKSWYAGVRSGTEVLYFSLELPNNVTTIAADGFRDQWSSEKERQNVVVNYDGNGVYTDKYKLVDIDFSEATSLTTIKSQAAMGCAI